MTNPSIKHPAKYTDSLIPVFARMLQGCRNILDPFAGTGKVFQLYNYIYDTHIDAIEIEPEWAALDSRITQGDSTNIQFPDDYFDGICVSPTYGNKMAGKISKDIDEGKWHRVKYADYLGRDLNINNTANFVWGKKYKNLHIAVWKECRRVLKNKGVFVLNIKNHISNGKEQLVTEWHCETLRLMGFEQVEWEKVETPSMRNGAHRDARIPYENVIKFVLYK